MAVRDPRYKEPLLLATTLDGSAWAVWRLQRDRWAVAARPVGGCSATGGRLQRDRWAVAPLPLAAKPMLGAQRAFAFGGESRLRLPELALLAGSVLAYAAALSAPMATGFWDRAARPPCGRLRRALSQGNCAELSGLSEQLRKKNRVTAHRKTGVDAHRRKKAVRASSTTT